MTIKRLLALLLAFATVLSLSSTIELTAFAATSGSCGDNLTWKFNSDGTLTISGTGAMTEFNSGFLHLPWRNIANSIQRVVIADGVTNIGNMAFDSCASLTSISIPDSVTTIGFGAFDSCVSLTSISLPDSLTTIGGRAFAACHSLTSITIPDSVTSLGEEVFYYCDNLSNVTLGKGLSLIPSCAFRDCYSLTSLFIPESITYIDDTAFNGFEGLKMPTIYYGGTEAQWKKIKNLNSIPELTEAHIIYNSNQAVSDGEQPVTRDDIRKQLGNIAFGPYALKGAVIDILGYEIPLIDLEASLTLDVSDNLKIVADSGGKLKVLLGFDDSASANIQGSSQSPTYWSDSYQEVKSMYQEITGKKVDTTRLWNKFSATRGKLKKLNANMVVGVSAELAGYLEFDYKNGKLNFSEGGMIAAFDASSNLRSYYGPCYVALGIEAGIEGSLVFTNENSKVNPEITVSPEFTIAAGGGIGTKSTYAQIDAYGTLSAKIATSSTTPFEAGVDMGVRWMGYILGKEIFQDSKSIASMELYPNFGDPWEVSLLSLTPGSDVSSTKAYHHLINSAQTINRSYLTSPYSMRTAANYGSASFVKQNTYPLSSPRFVSFDDNTMLLVWVDDTGEKTDENMCSILYSYFDGTNWSEPSAIFEDGTASDMPAVYSDGRYAYIVWQKSTQVFDTGADMSEMLQKFDLYATVFDHQTKEFTDPISINSGDDAAFEFNPVVFGNNGEFTVAWLENTDNNVYQMSGENTLHTAEFSLAGECLDATCVLTTQNMFTDLVLGDGAVYYCVLEETNNLYLYQETHQLLAQEIHAIGYAGGLLYYSAADGFFGYDGNCAFAYDGIGAMKNFQIVSNHTDFMLFTSVLNEDFTKDLYYSSLTPEGWSNLAVYSKNGKYIRDYVPVLLDDGTVHVAFNYVEADMGSAAVVVDQCTDEVDISLKYVDFDDTQLSTGTVDLRLGVQNNSATAINAFIVEVLDESGAALHTQEVTGALEAFENKEITIDYTLPEDYFSEIYTVSVLPTDYTDLNQTDNTAQTTFECVHNHSDNWTVTVAPTQSASGIRVLRCSKCSAQLAQMEIQPLKFSGASLSLQHNLAINYKVDKALFEDVGYSNPYVIFELNGVQTTLSSYSDSGDRYVFTFRNIAPNQMADTVKATLYATFDGVEYASATREYSVAEYCYSMLDQYAADEHAELRTLLVDLLHYGTASQAYTEYKVDALVNAFLTETQLTWGTSKEPVLNTVLDTVYKTVENPSAKWKGASLYLQESVSMRLRFTAECIDGLSVKIESEESTWTIPSDKFLEEDGMYYVYFTGLNAGQMRQNVYLTVYKGDDPVSYTACYSVCSYAYEKQNSTIPGLADLVTAMMKYGDSAYAYTH